MEQLLENFENELSKLSEEELETLGFGYGSRGLMGAIVDRWYLPDTLGGDSAAAKISGFITSVADLIEAYCGDYTNV